MNYSRLQEDLDKHFAYLGTLNPTLEKLLTTCQKALRILDWDSMGPLLKNAIIGLNDVCAKRLPNEKELVKILHYSTAVANYAVIWKTDTIPEKGDLEKGNFSLKTVEPLIGPDSEKQKIGVDSLLKLYSQLKSFSESAAKLEKLGSSAALMWQAFRAGQQLRENLLALIDQSSHVLTIMDDFGARSSSMSIHLGANVLNPAIQQLSSAYEKLHEDIRNSALLDKLQPEKIPFRIEMLQNSILTATGVFELEKQVDPSMEQIQPGMKLIELDTEQDDPGKKQEEDWEAL